MVSLTPTQAGKEAATFSNQGRPLPCGKPCKLPTVLTTSALRPSLQQGESSMAARTEEEKEKGREENRQDRVPPLLPLLCTSLQPRTAMITNGHGTANTCGLLPSTSPMAQCCRKGLLCPSWHPVPTIRQCHRLSDRSSKKADTG